MPEAKQPSGLAIVESTVSRKPISRPFLVHAIRLAVVVAIVFLVRLHHQKALDKKAARLQAPIVSVESLQAVWPTAVSISEWKPNGTAEVLEESGHQLGTILHTGQESSQIIGYVGSTYLMIQLGDEGRIVGVVILQSDDTPEHVQAILDDDHFLKQWNGLAWRDAADQPDADSVSGATLTALAIVQTIRARLGNPQPSLKFPKPVSVSEIKEVWGDVVETPPVDENPGWFQALDQDGQILGFFLRSSPIADSINGYQGPADLLAFFDPERKFMRMVIRSSYDNMEPEPFVDYVKQEEYFLVDQFNGLTLQQLANFDEGEVEGVSGATMTSQGVFRALQYSVQQMLQKQRENPQPSAKSSLNIALRDLGTFAVVITGLLVTFTRLRSVKFFRRIFNWTLVIYLGFINGDILSQTLFVGWAQNGVPWTNALGLVFLSVAALLVPVATKRNVYCQSLCPFGAAQQLAGKVLRKKPKVPRFLNRAGRILPGVLILLVATAAVWDWGLNLASIEPFDAFSIQIAGWATIVIATIGLLASVPIPMAYCRYGCPTGGMLNYIRRHRRSDRIGWGDWLAILILAIAMLGWWLG